MKRISQPDDKNLLTFGVTEKISRKLTLSERYTDGMENILKISYKCIVIPFNCNLNGIQNCKGGCCNSSSFWPPKAYDNSICGMLTKTGCILNDNEKPIDCLLYPLRINNNGTVILHHRTRFKKGICKGNCGIGQPLFYSIKNNIITLFGIDIFNEIEYNYINKIEKDIYLKMSNEIIDRYKLEKDLCKKNLKLENSSKF